MGKALAIRLNKSAEKLVKSGHPWVFESSIEKGPSEKMPDGRLCVIFDQRTNRPFAFGLWDSEEIIRIKILQRSNSLLLNINFWETQIQKALDKRIELLKNVSGYRAINGENDEFPGLILDVYSSTGVVKIYSKIWKDYLDELIPLFLQIFNLKNLVIRFSRKLSKNSGFSYNEGEVVGESLLDEKITFEEYGVLFNAYPITGHKTGFFLDQRPNRYWVQQHSKGKRVLDVFSYVGGFGLHALKGGAQSLYSIDISQHAMEVAKENLLLNHFELNQWTSICGDAFEEMQALINSKKTFDLVIIDPPSFAKKASEVALALKKYRRLTELGAELTSSNGCLILGSCSSRVSVEDFKTAHELALGKSGKWKLFKEIFHDIDHPIGFPEAAYLKTFYYKRS